MDLRFNMVQTLQQQQTGHSLRTRWIWRIQHWEDVAWMRQMLAEVRAHITSLHLPSGENAPAIARWREIEDVLRERIAELGG